MKLHQLLPIIQKTKAAATKAKTAVYHIVQKRELFEGLSRSYTPVDDAGYVYPSESKVLQMRATQCVEEFAKANEALFNDCASQDWSNRNAIADLEVDGRSLLRDVPVTYLLFLEKQIADIKTFVSSLPIQDISEEWIYDTSRDCFVSAPKQTTKTKKINKPVVLYEATKEHPAQVQLAAEDVIEGTWTAIKFTGALPQSQVNELMQRVEKLERAIAKAREAANQVEVEQQSVATPIFSYLFNVELG